MTTAVSPEQATALARLAQEQLAAYCVVASKGYEVVDTRHLRLAIEYLEALERGDILKLMMFWPPQHGKSSLVSQRFPAWYLGRHPTERVILGSYGQVLASRNGRLVRNQLVADSWPFTVGIAYDSRAVNRWDTNQGGGLIAVGVGTGLTGQPGDLMSLDDPIKDRKEADSPVVRENGWNWYTDVWQTRRSPKARELLTETRWHDDDIAGRILNSAEAKEWTVLELPALAEEADDPLGRPPGAALWPERYDEAWLEGMKRTMPTRSWVAMYQQKPVPDAGAMFRKEWMQRRWIALPPDRIDDKGKPYAGPWRTVMTVDSAWDEGVGHDRSAIALWATDGADFYLLHCWADQVEFPDLQAQVRAIFQGSRWRPAYVFVENKANGRPLIQQLQRTLLDDGTRLPVVALTPIGSKIARAEATTPLFLAGMVYLDPAGGEWLEEWITEHLRFPLGTHDDRVDTTSMALLAMNPHLAAGMIEITVAKAGDQGATHAQQRLKEAVEAQKRRQQNPTQSWRPRPQGNGPARVR